MTLSLELEIKTLLEEFGDPEVVAKKLIELFEDHREEWSPESLKELARFFLVCGLHQTLLRFCLQHIAEKQFAMPWPYFLQALHLGWPNPSPEIVGFVRRGLEEELASERASLAAGAITYIPAAEKFRQGLLDQRRRFVSETKAQMLSELLTFRTQQLYEQEKLILSKMQRMFPGDADILEELRQHKERYALDILSRRSPLAKAHAPAKETPPSPEVRRAQEALSVSLLEEAAKHPELAYDLAIVAFVLEEPQTSLAILEKMDLTPAQSWFYLEVKIQCRHFLEVLNEVGPLEVALAHEPETFFAAAYLRAQAYWGLTQKHVAIEILESILSARPHYRASATLLEAWRTQ